MMYEENYMVAAFSKINERNPENKIKFRTDMSDETVLGFQTNEAPTKLFLNRLAEEGKLLDRIILLTTRECEEEKLQNIGGQTSLAYYKAEIQKHVRQLMGQHEEIRRIICERYEGSEQVYIERTVCTVMTSDVGFDQLQRTFSDAIGDNQAEKKNLYFDFTGGSRITSLMSLFLLRILERSGFQVRQVVYADIFGEKRLVDCLGIYNMCLCMEYMASGNRRKVDELLQAVGIIISEDEKTHENYLVSVKKEIQKDLFGKKRNSQEQGFIEAADAVKLEGFFGRILKNTQKEVEKALQEDFYTRLRKKTDADLITTFYEEFYNFLVEREIIVGCESANNKPAEGKAELQWRLAKRIQAFDRYYEFESEGCSYGVTAHIRKILDYLSTHLYKEPLSYYTACYKVNHDFYKQYKCRYPKSPNYYMTRGFQIYLRNNHILQADSMKNMTPDDYLKTYETIKTTYFNYGFPFVCIDDARWQYDEVQAYYKGRAEKLFGRLSELRKKSMAEYTAELERLKQDGELEKEIPIKMDFRWRLNQELLQLPEGKTEAAFLEELVSRMEQVRPVRNILSHRKAGLTEEEQATVEDTAHKIHLWLQEYQNIFVET